MLIKGGGIMITGLDSLLGKLENLKQLPVKMQPVVDQCLIQMEGSARQFASGPRPERIDKVTGYLVDHIEAQPSEVHGTIISGSVDCGADYGINHEYGTSRLPARPFMGPAMMENEEGCVEKLNEVIRGLV